MGDDAQARLHQLESLANVNVVNAIEKTLWAPNPRSATESGWGDRPISYQTLYLKTNAKEGLYAHKKVNVFNKHKEFVESRPAGFKGGIVLMNESSWGRTHIVTRQGDILVQHGEDDEHVLERQMIIKFKDSAPDLRSNGAYYIRVVVWKRYKKENHIVTRARMQDILETIRRYNAESKARCEQQSVSSLGGGAI